LNYARRRPFLSLRHRLGTNHLVKPNYRERTLRRKSGGLSLINRLGRLGSFITGTLSGHSASILVQENK